MRSRGKGGHREPMPAEYRFSLMTVLRKVGNPDFPAFQTLPVYFFFVFGFFPNQLELVHDPVWLEFYIAEIEIFP